MSSVLTLIPSATVAAKSWTKNLRSGNDLAKTSVVDPIPPPTSTTTSPFATEFHSNPSQIRKLEYPADVV